MKHISGDKTVKAGIVYRYMWFLIAAVIFAFGQASCSSDNDDPEPEPEPDPTAVAASFTASIKPLGARASSDLWSKGDEIGVFMVSNGSVLSDGSIVGDGINRNLRTSGDRDGKFQPLNNNHRLFFPTDGSKVDFIAYHPYRSDSHVANYKYVINL